MNHPLTPIEVSGTFEVTDEQYTQMIGVTSNDTQKFTFTFSLPTDCTVRNNDVFYGDYWIGKVNKFDASKVDICNVEFVSCNRDDEGIVFEFRQVE